jgi:hypothetical protein
MGTINFGLIRLKNPDVGSVDNIEDIDSLNLSGCEIRDIDNLELFHHIHELNLSNNQIERIEELLLFINLQILDVSDNCIDATGLRSSISQLPKSLVSINLSGNPCAKDLDALGELQDVFPDLVIAIEEDRVVVDNDRDGDEKDGCNDDDDDDDDENDDGHSRQPQTNSRHSPMEPLDSDDILKMIVDRKCKLQQIQTSFDLQLTVTVS